MQKNPHLKQVETKKEPVRRISFIVSQELMDRSRSIIWGGRSIAMRVLLEKLVAAVEKHGLKMIGAIVDGDFEIVPRGEKK